MARSAKGRGGRGQLRIIGGQWRGRKLTFRAAEGLRPTTDRIRETLFNWLATEVPGARCADLFAGSGALGLEALSRGAAHCDFVDTSAAALRQIHGHLETLDAGGRASCHALPAAQFLGAGAPKYDIVFVDPPFSADLSAAVIEVLAERHVLADGGWVYLESATGQPSPSVPAGWQLHREKTSGGVCYRLFVVASKPPAAA